MDKKAWRRAARALFALTTREERAALDAALCGRLREQVAQAGACGREQVLLGYAALPDEADVTAFLLAWLRGGGRLALPVWQGGRDMAFREIRDWDRDVMPGRGGIPEPAAACAAVSAEAIACAIVPGRFFSERCDRLGRGAGCYDALLSRRGAGLRALGAAYDFQILPALPVDEHDCPVDAVVTPTRTIRKMENGTNA